MPNNNTLQPFNKLIFYSYKYCFKPNYTNSFARINILLEFTMSDIRQTLFLYFLFLICLTQNVLVLYYFQMYIL